MLRLSRTFNLPLSVIREWPHEDVEAQLSFDYICSPEFQKQVKKEQSVIDANNINKLMDDLKWLT